MRIAFLTSAFAFGGAQMSTLELAERLSSTHKVKFFDSYGYSDPFITAIKDRNIEYTILSKSSSPFIVSKYKNRLFNYFRYFLFFSKWYQLKLNTKANLVQFKPDIVIVYDDRCLSYLIRFKNKKFKTIFYARGWYTPQQTAKITRILIRKYVDSIICISEATRHAMFCSGIADLEKIFVVHNSINIDKLIEKQKPFDIKESKFKIIHSGGFLPSKGQHVALEAAKILYNKGVDFHMYLCGIIYPGLGDKSKKYYEEQLNYIKQNNLEDIITLVVGESNIISYIKNSDIMFFPSSSEGLPRSVLEAMALGKPVIANAVGGVTDLILDNYTGFISKHNNAIEYARYADLLFKNQTLYNQISTNANNLIKNSFSEELQKEKMNEIFQLVNLGE